MKKKILAATAVTGLAAVAAIPAFAGTKTVKVGDNYFVHDGGRPTVTISKGSTLKFVWRGHAPHNILKKKGPGGRINSVRCQTDRGREVQVVGLVQAVATTAGTRRSRTT